MASTTATNGSNSSSTQEPRPLNPGISVPLLTFFHDNEDLDLETQVKHALRLARAGLTSLTLLGSNGEACHLLPAERKIVTSTVRKALDENGFQSLPLIVGCTAQSARETIQFCRDAHDAGGDYAIILPPSYYRPAMTDQVLIDYFQAVADASPIGIVLYNYPGAVAGIDMSSDVISTLAQHPNIVGCKLTCGNTGKLARIASSIDAATPTRQGSGWMCMGGSADFTLQTLIAGGSGIITGLGNIVPKTCVKLLELYAQGKVEEAKSLQAIVARGDWAVISGGVVGTKAGLESWYGYGGISRRPLPKARPDEVKKWRDMLAEVVEYENNL